jgi:hypothetical protein
MDKLLRLADITNDNLSLAAVQVKNDPRYSNEGKKLELLFLNNKNTDTIDSAYIKLKAVANQYSTRTSDHDIKILAKILSAPELNFDKRIMNGEISIVNDILFKSTQLGANSNVSLVTKMCMNQDYIINKRDRFPICSSEIKDMLPIYYGYYKLGFLPPSELTNKVIGEDYTKLVWYINNLLRKCKISINNPRRHLDWFLWYQYKGFAGYKNKRIDNYLLLKTLSRSDRVRLQIAAPFRLRKEKPPKPIFHQIKIKNRRGKGRLCRPKLIIRGKWFLWFLGRAPHARAARVRFGLAFGNCYFVVKYVRASS